MSSRKETLERLLASAQRELEMLASRPMEPPLEDEPTVVRFDLRYPNRPDQAYSFAAIRVGGGQWYTTGNPRFGQTIFPSWEALWDDLDLDNRLVGKVWVVTEYEELP